MRSIGSGRALRYGGWGVCAALAVVSAVVASRSDFAQRRAERQTLADAADVSGAVARQERENRRLAAALRDLSDDRERLAMRIATLERGLLNLSEATGSTGPINGRTEVRAVSERTRIYPPVELPVIATPPAGTPGEPGATQLSPTAPNGRPPSPTARPGAGRETPSGVQSSATPESALTVPVPQMDRQAASAQRDPVQPAAAERTPAREPQPPLQATRVPAPPESQAPLRATPPTSAPTQANLPSAPPASPATGSTEPSRTAGVSATPPQGRTTPTTSNAGEQSSKPAAAVREPEAPPLPLRPPVKLSDRIASEDQQPISASVAPPASAPVAPAAAAFAAVAQPSVSGTRESDRAKEKAAESVATRTEFGVDVGGGTTLAALRDAWTSLKANQGPLIGGLRPVMAVRESAAGLELRLLAGPLPNAAQAARLCAALASAGRTCAPAVFEGQRLAAQ